MPGGGQGEGRVGAIGGGTRRTAAHRGGRWRNQEGGLDPICPGQDRLSLILTRRPQQDSNLRTRLRSALLKIALTCTNLAFPVI